MKKIFVLLFVLISVVTFSQKKETFDDRAELERITKAINLSGESLKKSAQHQINGLVVIGVGSFISALGGLAQSNEIIAGGAVISTLSIPYFISSIINKRNAGDEMMKFTLKNNSSVNVEIAENISLDPISDENALSKEDIEGYTKGSLNVYLKNDRVIIKIGNKNYKGSISSKSKKSDTTVSISKYSEKINGKWVMSDNKTVKKVDKKFITYYK
jgi:hypothetical protein